MRRTTPTRIGLLALALAVVLASGCRDAAPPERPTAEPDVEPNVSEASFALALAPGHAGLARATIEPVEGPMTVSGGTSRLALRAFTKRVPMRPELTWVELLFENRGDVAMRDVRVEIVGGASVLDVTRNPFADVPAPSELLVGGIAPDGFGRLALAFSGQAPQTLSLRVRGVDTRFTSTASSTLAVTPDGAEIWAPFADGDTVAVIDTGSDRRVDAVVIEGRPTSVAAVADGATLLVTAAATNRLHVIDRATRKITQTFGEEQGIGREPRHVVMTPDGSRAFVSAYVGDAITVLVRHGRTFEVERVLKVGRRPSGMGITADGRTLLVSHLLPRGTALQNEGWITVLATDPPSVLREVPIHDDLNLREVECLTKLFPVSPIRLATEGVPTELAGVFLSPGGAEAWTPGARISAQIAWEHGPKSVPLSTFAAIRQGELLAPFLFLFDTRDGPGASRLLSPGVLDPPDANLDQLRCTGFQLEPELISRDLVPGHPDEQVNRAAALPTFAAALSETGPVRAIAFSRGGRRALVVSHAADEIALYDAVTHHPATQRHFPLAGSNPTGLALLPDGRKGYVAYENSTFVSVLDTSKLAEPGQLPGPTFVPYSYRDIPEFPSAPGILTRKRIVRRIDAVPDRPPLVEVGQVAIADHDPVEALLRRGGVLFASSNPSKYPGLTGTRLGTCASCHPGGGSDGSLWGTMEGERRTMSLRGGVQGRGWLHASGTHRDIVEFVRSIVKERFGGDLAEPDVDALSAYVARGIPRLQSPPTDGALAAHGQDLFAAHCASCHQGPTLTSGRPDSSVPFGGGAESGPGLYDVGTASSDSHAILGSFFESLFPPLEAKLFHALRGDRALGPGDEIQSMLDFRPRPARARGELKAPALVNVWDHVLYFHDGRFDRLEDAVHYMNEHVVHGLSDADERAIVEFLRTQ